MSSEEAYEIIQECMKQFGEELALEECSMAIEELYEKSCMYDDLLF